MRLDHLLRGGDKRSLGRTPEVIEAVLADRSRLAELVECLADDDPVVRMRAGDALEKVARRQPGWLLAWIDPLLRDLGTSVQPSLQWHLAQIVEEVPLTATQRGRAVEVLRGWLEQSEDWIVLTCVMQSLTTLALDDDPLRGWLTPRLRYRLKDPRPAVAKRAARQLARLDRRGRAGLDA